MTKRSPTKTTSPASVELPANVLATDLTYPKVKATRTEADYERARVLHILTLHYTARFGWCVATLHIRNPGRRSTQTTARTYGVTLDGQVVTIGMGPHVLRTIELYVTAARVAALQRYLDLKEKGLADAGEIRDRISTRRAQTVQRRSASFDRWDA